MLCILHNVKSLNMSLHCRTVEYDKLEEVMK